MLTSQPASIRTFVVFPRPTPTFRTRAPRRTRVAARKFPSSPSGCEPVRLARLFRRCCSSQNERVVCGSIMMEALSWSLNLPGQCSAGNETKLDLASVADAAMITKEQKLSTQQCQPRAHFLRYTQDSQPDPRAKPLG